MSAREDDDFDWICAWYRAHCDGDWEHGFGVRLESMDNPGWYFAVDLKGTELERVPFSRVEHNLADAEAGLEARNWWHCEVENGTFNGYCGPWDIRTVFKYFRLWAETNSAKARAIAV